MQILVLIWITNKIYHVNFFFRNFMLMKNFETLAIYLKDFAIVILECDCSMGCGVDDEVWPFPFAFQFPVTKEFES